MQLHGLARGARLERPAPRASRLAAKRPVAVARQASIKSSIASHVSAPRRAAAPLRADQTILPLQQSGARLRRASLLRVRADTGAIDSELEAVAAAVEVRQLVQLLKLARPARLQRLRRVW